MESYLIQLITMILFGCLYFFVIDKDGEHTAGELFLWIIISFLGYFGIVLFVTFVGIVHRK